MGRSGTVNKEKGQALEQLLNEQVEVQNIEESTSSKNDHVFVIKKKSGKRRMLRDLRSVNRVIKSMGPLQPGISLPYLLPKSWPLVVI